MHRLCTQRAACSRIANNTDASLAVAHPTNRKSGEQSASRATARKFTGSPFPCGRADVVRWVGPSKDARSIAHDLGAVL
jgi:hypothetical protein